MAPASTESQSLRNRARQARHLVYLAQQTLTRLGHRVDERTMVVLPLVLSSLDMADTVCYLLEAAPERYWVGAAALQRAQIEHLLRAAFFARAGTIEEVEAFRTDGKLPKRPHERPGRPDRTIYLREIAEEAYHDVLGEDLPKLLTMIKNHHGDLSGFLHGGKEIVDVYSRMHDELGNIELEWEELLDTVDNVAVFVQFAVGVAMSISPLEPEQIDAAARECYEQGMAYMHERPRAADELEEP
jgi:hypothetical protein